MLASLATIAGIRMTGWDERDRRFYRPVINASGLDLDHKELENILV